MKTFLSGLAALCLCGLASCSGDKVPSGVYGTMTIGVMSVEIKSAGIFNDSSHGGVGLVFCSGKVPLDRALSEVPDGAVLCLDVPEEMMDGVVRDLSGEAGGGTWAFCYSAYSDNDGIWMDGLGDFHTLEGVTLGYFRGVRGRDGRVHVEFYAYSGEGFAVGCTFDGVPEVADEYIWAWDL